MARYSVPILPASIWIAAIRIHFFKRGVEGYSYSVVPFTRYRWRATHLRSGEHVVRVLFTLNTLVVSCMCNATSTNNLYEATRGERVLPAILRP
jgi:hypothetical protein